MLIVGEYAMMVQALGSALQGEPGIDVVGSVFGADEAARAAERLAPDVVVLDGDLGGMACYSVTKEMAAGAPHSRVVVLGTTEHDASGGDYPPDASYLLKNETIEALLRALRSMGRPQGPRSAASSLLSPREREVLSLLAEGMPNKAIARHLGVSLHTVRNHVQRILAKLGVHSKLEAVAKAAREGLVHYR